MVIADAIDVLGRILGSGFRSIFVESFNELSYAAQISSISCFYLTIYYGFVGLTYLAIHIVNKKYCMPSVQDYNNLQMIHN